MVYFDMLLTILRTMLQETGRSALFMASEQDNLEIVKLLVERGANVDVKDKVLAIHYHKN